MLNVKNIFINVLSNNELKRRYKTFYARVVSALYFYFHYDSSQRRINTLFMKNKNYNEKRDEFEIKSFCVFFCNCNLVKVPLQWF